MKKLRNVRPMLFQVLNTCTRTSIEYVCVSDVFNIRIMRNFKEPLNDIRHGPMPAREKRKRNTGTRHDIHQNSCP